MSDLQKFPIIKFNNTNVMSKTNNEAVSFKASSNSIIFPPKSGINFYSYNNSLAKKKTGRLLELIFFGLNYNAKRIRHMRKPWVLDLQKSHKIKVDESRTSEIKTKIFKRRVLFFSFDRQAVTSLVDNLKKARSQNSYSGHGLILKTDKYSTKPGKIRQK